MKVIFSFIVILLFSYTLCAQTVETPFKKYGYDVLVATSSKGEFTEFHDQKDIVEIGSLLYNTKTKQIVQVLDEGESTIDISTAIAAMSIDPHCEKYYWISPYAYVANNPLKYIDPDGRDIRLWMTTTAKNGALSRQQVPYSALNEQSQLALTAFITADISKEFLSNYVNGSQNIGGVELSGSTEFNQNLDIIFNDGTTIIYGDGTAGHINGSVKTAIGDNSFNTEIRIDKNLSAESMTETFGHEAFLHGEGNLKTVLDNFKPGMSDKNKSDLKDKLSTGSLDHKNRSLRTGTASNRFDRFLNYARGFFLNNTKINEAINSADDENNKNVQNGR